MKELPPQIYLSVSDLPEPYRLVEVDTIDSTNELARLKASRGCADFTLVWAREQTAGRGTRGRDWISPRDNLFWSLVLRPEGDWIHLETLSYTAAVAVGEMLLQYLKDDTLLSYKWPNDVLIAGQKISGILIEASSQPIGKPLSEGGSTAAQFEWLVIGVGINNVACPPAELTRYPAISIARAVGHPFPVEDLMREYSVSFLTWFRRWREEGFAPIRSKIMERLIGTNSPIDVQIGHDVVTGKFADLAEDGTAVFQTEHGQCIRVRSGEVIYNPNAKKR